MGYLRFGHRRIVIYRAREYHLGIVWNQLDDWNPSLDGRTRLFLDRHGISLGNDDIPPDMDDIAHRFDTIPRMERINMFRFHAMEAHLFPRCVILRGAGIGG